VLGDPARNRGVAIPRRVFPSPRIEAKADRGAFTTGRIVANAEDRPGIAQPGIVGRDVGKVDPGIGVDALLGEHSSRGVLGRTPRNCDVDVLATL
jgi:hypothetical protein